MKIENTASGGVILSRFDSNIQFAARRDLAQRWKTDRIDLITAEDPLHLFFHDVDREEIDRLGAHIETFLNSAQPKRLALASGPRPDVLTDEEVKRKVSTAVQHLSRRFPAADVEGLFVHPQTGCVERVSSNEE